MSSENNETRIRILKAAWHLLEASQGKGVRLSDIAKQAGISRQAIYLHFSKRSEVLIATTRYIDVVNDVDTRLIASRTAENGVARMNAFIKAWGDYIPEIYGVAKALLAMKETDEAAEMAWNDRMQAFRVGCEAVIITLKSDGILTAEYTSQEATDILWTLLSVRNWEQLTIECGWTVEKYIEKTQRLAQDIFVKK